MSTDLTSDEQRAIGEACRDLHIAHVEYRQVEAGWLARAAYERPSHPGRQAAIEAAAVWVLDSWDREASQGQSMPALAAEQPRSEEERATPQPDMHVAYLGRCVEATEVERDQAQAALTTERHRTEVAEGERDEARRNEGALDAALQAAAGERREAERLREALRIATEYLAEAVNGYKIERSAAWLKDNGFYAETPPAGSLAAIADEARASQGET